MSAASPCDPPRPSGTDLTEQVLTSLTGASDPRFRLLLESLVRHTHAFVREVGLTESEWRAGIEFLTRCGHITDDRAQVTDRGPCAGDVGEQAGQAWCLVDRDDHGVPASRVDDPQ